MKMDDSGAVLKQISKILGRSFIAAMAVLILWLVIYFAAGDYWFSAHGKFFDLGEHELAILNYAGMGLFKILAVCFLLCPFVAIETVIRFKKNKA
jgi:Family of unknown function (DUF6868)